jgi:predicted N-acetyltransferase YhbS
VSFITRRAACRNIQARLLNRVMEQPELEIRRASPSDRAAILQLGARTLEWLGDAQEGAFFAWKHEQNPFGESPMWVACDGNQVVGFRTFMRWEFTVDGRLVRAVRAVDTATDPEYQGRGIFTRLTLAALDELRDEGVEMVFNTPNSNSLPGYLKMGWLVVGRLPVSIMPTRVRSIPAIAAARVPASRTAVLIHAGDAPRDAFTDHEGVGSLLATIPDAPGLETRKSPEFFAWRYGHEPLHYRVVRAGPSIGDGFAVFHLRRRGPAVEAVLCDVVVPNPHEPDARRLRHGLARRVARLSGADYVLRIDGRPITADPFVRVPHIGPLLTFRTLTGWIPPRRGRWRVNMGDIELF